MRRSGRLGAGVNDLLALAVVRRLLLELGCVLAPYETHPHLGALGAWIMQPRPELEGQSPLSALARAGGEERVRRCLWRVLGGDDAPTAGA
jgi:hypothetical protein